MPLFLQKDHARSVRNLATATPNYLLCCLKNYSRFVLYSKWGLLIVAALLVISVIIWPLVNKDSAGIRLSFVDSKSVDKPVNSPVMHHPQYSAFGADGAKHTIMGEQAVQQTPTLIVIDQVDARVAKPDGTQHQLTADIANYQQDQKILSLSQNVVLLDDQKNRFTTASATIELSPLHIYGKEPIVGNGPFGKLLASSFEIIDDGNHIIFRGSEKPVRVTMNQAKKAQ